MNFDIRKHVIDNFRNDKEGDIKEAIENALETQDEITLPGMGVFFEILWKNSNSEEQNNIVKSIKNGL